MKKMYLVVSTEIWNDSDDSCGRFRRCILTEVKGAYISWWKAKKRAKEVERALRAQEKSNQESRKQGKEVFVFEKWEVKIKTVTIGSKLSKTMNIEVTEGGVEYVEW